MNQTDLLDLFLTYWPLPETGYIIQTGASETGKKTTVTKNNKPTKNTVLDHLKGRQRIGYLPGTPSGMRCGMLDFDLQNYTSTTSKPQSEQLDEDVSKLCRVLDALSLPYNLARSTSGKGWHVWVWLDEELEHKTIKAALEALRTKAGIYGKTEVFPKGDHTSNRIYLPYFGALKEPGLLGATSLLDGHDDPIPLDEVGEYVSLADSSILKMLATENPQKPIPLEAQDSLDLTPEACWMLADIMLQKAPKKRHEGASAFLNLYRRAGNLQQGMKDLTRPEVFKLWIADGTRTPTEWQQEVSRWADTIERKGPNGRGIPYLKSEGYLVPSLPSTKKMDLNVKVAEPVKLEKTQWSLTTQGAAERLTVLLAGKIKYIDPLGWVYFDGRKWTLDESLTTVSRLAANALYAGISTEIQKASTPEEHQALLKYLRQLGSAKAIPEALSIARTLPAFHTKHNKWNTDERLFLVENGVLDLKTGTLHPHSPEFNIMQAGDVTYNPAATHPHVEDLKHLLAQDDRLETVQRILGSLLWGQAPNEMVFVLEGLGGTSKSTILNAVMAVMGTYAKTTSIETFLQKPATGATPELLHLMNARLVVAGEPDKNRRFAAALKLMTGGDPITARGLYSNTPVTFKPQFKVILHTNTPIKADPSDSGLRRRLLTIPFTAKPEKLNPMFKHELCNNPEAKSAMLNWMLEGLRKWLHSGFDLAVSTSIEAHTDHYWLDQSVLDEFAGDCLEFDPAFTAPVGSLSLCLQDWCQTHNVPLADRPNRNEVNAWLKGQGLVQGHTTTTRFWIGVRLKPLQLDDDHSGQPEKPARNTKKQTPKPAPSKPSEAITAPTTLPEGIQASTPEPEAPETAEPAMSPVGDKLVNTSRIQAASPVLPQGTTTPATLTPAHPATTTGGTVIQIGGLLENLE